MASTLGQRIDQFLRDHGKGVDAVLVLRHGCLVYETYSDPYDVDTPHILNSCTKSFLSTLAGIAVDRGYVPSVDWPIWRYFPNSLPSSDDSRKSRITVKHLLTMSSGIDWPQYGRDNISDRMVVSPNWVEFILSQPMAAEPGTVTNYSNGDSHLVAAILRRATKQDLLDFATTELFTLLGITEVRWDRDPQGLNIGSATLYLRPRDMAKLGQLVLNDGEWRGRQLVSTDWIRAATARQTMMPSVQLTDYGYFWWLYPDQGRIEAWGGSGQRIAVFPHADLVIVITSTSDDDTPRSAIADAIYTQVLDAISSPH